ncbi:MAG: hypothetical protein PHO20_03790 [Candidatus Peribacteraceae bacterium]|nr:hypothetical protein [Candidatus Peribacteraceae bacterium]MDD5739863.1 hypothetical protein [Candidatus Peribacteraceae bacterium]
MRLCCGVVQLLRDRTGCTLAEAAQCLGEPEDRITDWQMILHESNAPLPTLAELNDFCLFSLDIAQRRAVMTRLSNRPAVRRSEQSQKAPHSSHEHHVSPEQRMICAMANYLRAQFGFLQKDAAAAVGVSAPTLSTLNRRIEEDGGQGITQEEALRLLVERVGIEELTNLAETSPRIAQMRGEEQQKPLPPRNEFIQSDWRRICAMIEVLRVQFQYTVSQAAGILRVNLPSYYAWLRKLGQDGGHGIAPEEALILLERRLGSERLAHLAHTCPRTEQRMAAARHEADVHEPYDREDAEWQMFLAVELLLHVPDVDQVLACAAMQMSEATYERYRERFREREQTVEDRQRAAVLIVDLFDGELPKTQEEISQRLEELYGRKPASRFFRNVLEAIQMGDGESFEGCASDDYVPTDAIPGCREKQEVILGRIRRGDPSGFHPGDRCAYLNVKRADFIRMAIEEGMKK